MVTFDRPDGWITFDVSSEPTEDGEGLYVQSQVSLCTTNTHGRKPVYAYVLQIIVVANHMGGKDTHVRGLRVLGPIECVSPYGGHPRYLLHSEKSVWTTIHFRFRLLSSKCSKPFGNPVSYLLVDILQCIYNSPSFHHKLKWPWGISGVCG